MGGLKGAISYETEQQLLILDFAEELGVGEHDLKITYKGILNDELAGFYRTKEVDSATGEVKWALVTQFEACDARRALPCWDEPDRKARFQVLFSYFYSGNIITVA